MHNQRYVLILVKWKVKRSIVKWIVDSFRVTHNSDFDLIIFDIRDTTIGKCKRYLTLSLLLFDCEIGIALDLFSMSENSNSIIFHKVSPDVCNVTFNIRSSTVDTQKKIM